MRDPVFASSVAGMAGATAKALVSHLAFLLELTNVSYLHMLQRIVSQAPLTATGPNLMVAAIGIVAFGGPFGVLLAYIYVLSAGTTVIAKRLLCATHCTRLRKPLAFVGNGQELD